MKIEKFTVIIATPDNEPAVDDNDVQDVLREKFETSSVEVISKEEIHLGTKEVNLEDREERER